MRFFFDTEFDAFGHSLQLISVGMVADDGRELYLVNRDYDFAGARPWLVENVLPHLADVPDAQRVPLAELTRQVIAFVGPAPGPERSHEFWAYNAAYDWFALSGLHGQLVDRPDGWPSGARDVKEMCRQLGNPNLPAQAGGEHDALADARWTAQAHAWLSLYRREQERERERKLRNRVLGEAIEALGQLTRPPGT